VRKDNYTFIMTQKLTVYFLTHKDSKERLRYYKTLAGARIAQRSRNAHLGFRLRLERIELEDNWEVERCELTDGTVIDATWAIEETVIDIESIE
jgi:hypothetical protein